MGSHTLFENRNHTKKILQINQTLCLCIPHYLCKKMEIKAGMAVSWSASGKSLVASNGNAGRDARKSFNRNSTVYVTIPVNLARDVGMVAGDFVKFTDRDKRPWSFRISRVSDPPKPADKKDTEQEKPDLWQERLNKKQSEIDWVVFEREEIEKKLEALKGKMARYQRVGRKYKINVNDKAYDPEPEKYTREWWLLYMTDGINTGMQNMRYGMECGMMWHRNPYFIMYATAGRLDGDLLEHVKDLLAGFDLDGPGAKGPFQNMHRDQLLRIKSGTAASGRER